ncbi:TonB-linked SusC/RagA family outer membrane protein [Dysgonomonas hofstadii]|uniref:TonB-linked SusC/RagA family outer membrane protein n=1 Tax=Dysgonomonas hofstadii TaxID=637886 RepID=A0A840CYQ0_9BACT|nr:TonB-dependent receptor [Dysgonomonas hofstadii]MBB4037865.1 TonB-linked SusC/RagA family outer membrane protein [Dysgonomonas hofstadii]
MKITTFFLFVCMISLSAGNLHSQKANISLNAKNITLRQVLDRIERESDYVFLVADDASSELSRKIEVKSENENIASILDRILNKTSLAYLITGRQISIYKNASNNVVSLASKEEQEEQQQKGFPVKGNVTDVDGNPLIGVTVKIRGNATQGTVTDIDGSYSITVADNRDALVFSYIGFKTQEVDIDNRKIVNITLYENTDELAEVVVVAYGTQKKASIIGAISSLPPQNIKAPVAKVSSQLAGQLAGVIAVQRSGEAGVGSTFWIRGMSTFSGENKPLVLVDGVERELDLVDPEDISEFSILKDAAATAIYGVRGANGVILVTTRSGEIGKPKITVKMEHGIVAPTRVPKMVNSHQYAEMYNDAVGYSFYSPEAIEAYRTGSDPVLYPNVDWVDELYNSTSSNTRISTNISGGSQSVRYYVSASYYNEGGLFINDNSNEYKTSLNYSQFRFRSNIDIDIFKYTTINVNLATSFEKKNQPGTKGSEIWKYALQTPSNRFPMVYPDGSLPGPGERQGFNPYSLLTQTGYAERFWNNTQSLFGITQDLGEYVTKGLKANIKVSFDAQNYNQLSRSRTADEWSATRNADGELEYHQLVKGDEALQYSESNSGRRTLYLEGSLSYARTFDAHSVSALFLYQQSQKNNIGNSDSDAALPYRNQGIAGRLTYDYDQRYFIEGNFGYNGSENFSRGHRFGFFPSVAAGWMASGEKFFQPLTNVIDMLKFKASYGLVGNDQIGGNRRFIYLPTIQSGNDYFFGENAQKYTSIRLGDWANEDVGWETAHKLNIGADISLFNKVKIQADYFYEKRDGIFLSRSAIPYYVGLTNQPWVNIGKMKNRGIDASIEYHQKVGQVNITARGNFTHARNVILERDQPEWKYAHQNRQGQSIYQSFGYVAAGIFKDQADVDSWADQSAIGGSQPGDIKYLDLNGDGIIDGYDQKAIGYTDIPETVYGFGASFEWKNFDFSIFFQGNANVNFSMRTNMTQPFISANMNESNVFADIYNNYWTPDRQDAKYPRLSMGTGSNDVTSSFWLADGSYMRLKNIELGYTLPKAITKRLRINDLRFYFSGVNILTFSKFKLWDPDLQTGAAEYPLNKVYSLGLALSF